LYISFFFWYAVFRTSRDSVELTLHMALDFAQCRYCWGHFLNVVPRRAGAERTISHFDIFDVLFLS
jgi:hypothetical protein